MPNTGDDIVMIGFGEMKVESDPADSTKGAMQRQLLMRFGRVEEVFPERHFMLKGPCIQTSIAIFSGMSGGLVARWSGGNTGIKPFALISHAPDPQPSYDRSQSGHAMGSILNPKIRILGDKEQVHEFAVSNIGVGKDGTKSQPISSFGFSPIG